MARAYKVARIFPVDIRDQARKILSRANITSFDAFISQARICPMRIWEVEARNEKRRYFAISGVSKILWHRFPQHGFLFDDQARRALANGGFGASFHTQMRAWGGPPHEDLKDDCDFLTFAAGYQKYCVPMYDVIEPFAELRPQHAALRDEARICAIRVIDKLLWLAGEEATKRQSSLHGWNSKATPAEVSAGATLANAAKQILKRLD
jgi:hypothetical protein